MRKEFFTLLLLFVLAVFALFSVSCEKEREPANSSNITVEEIPKEEEEEEQESPDMSWTMKIDDVLYSIDTTTISYHYENDLHIFSCSTGGTNIFSITLPGLDSAIYPVDFDHTVVEYIQGGTAYNGASNPQGSVHIFKNENNKISADFEARLFSFVTGQERQVTAGRLRNVPYTE